MLTNLESMISYPGNIAMTFGILAALTLATATLPLRTGTGQHADAGPGAVDVWQLRDTIRNAPRGYPPHRNRPQHYEPQHYEPRLYALPEPDDEIAWPENWPEEDQHEENRHEEMWPDTREITRRAEPATDAPKPPRRPEAPRRPDSPQRPELRIPSPLRTTGAHEEDQHTGRHRLVEPDLYGIPAEIDLRLNPVGCAAA